MSSVSVFVGNHLINQSYKITQDGDAVMVFGPGFTIQTVIVENETYHQAAQRALTYIVFNILEAEEDIINKIKAARKALDNELSRIKKEEEENYSEIPMPSK